MLTGAARMESADAVSRPSMDAAGRVALSVRGVNMLFPGQGGARTQALTDVTFNVASGEFVSVIGPSGCGKTTLLRICAGLLSQSAGQVEFEGKLDKIPPRQLGFVFQQPTLLPWRDLLANVLLPSVIFKADGDASTTRARQLLDRVGLSGSEHKYPDQLSGGMQQRAAIVRSLTHEPHILFMDEPFGALDAITRESMNELLQDIHLTQRVTTVFVTHSISEALFLSDRVIVLSRNGGRVVRQLEVGLERPRSAATLLSAEAIDLESQLRDALQPGSGS